MRPFSPFPSTPSPFPFEPSFTHAHRGRDHVFYTRVRVRASARAFVRVRAKIPRFSTESVESHLLLFPTRSLCPPASTCISAILGSLRSRSTCATPLHHARSGLVAMILHDPRFSFSLVYLSSRRRMKVIKRAASSFIFHDFAPIVFRRGGYRFRTNVDSRVGCEFANKTLFFFFRTRLQMCLRFLYYLFNISIRAEEIANDLHFNGQD